MVMWSGYRKYGRTSLTLKMGEESWWTILAWSVTLNIQKRFTSGYRETVGTAVAQWLRCCVTNPKVAGSIPAGVIGIFHWHNPSDRTMALGSSQPQKWVPGVFPGGKCDWYVRLTILPPSCAVVMECGSLTFLKPSGPLRACNGLILLFFIKRPRYCLVRKMEEDSLFRETSQHIAKENCETTLVLVSP